MRQYVQTGILIALAVAGIGLAWLVAVKLAVLLLLVLIALVITTGIDPVVQRMQRVSIGGRRLPRAAATLLILTATVLVFLGILTFFVVYGVNQSITFARDVWPDTRVSLTKLLNVLAAKYPSLVPHSDVLMKRLSAQSGQIAAYLWTTTRTVFGIIGGLFSVVTVFILTLFFSISKDGILYTLLQFVPPRFQAQVTAISHEAAERMGGWLRGQVTLAVIIMLLTTVGMLFFPHARAYAAMIGIVGGIGEMIPMLGPYVAFFPAAIIALVLHASLPELVILLVFFAALSQVENYLLAPKVMERHVKLSPVTTIFSLLAGGAVLGIVGALLAIPLAAAMRVVLLEAVFPAIQGKSRREIEDGCPGAHTTLPSAPPPPTPPLPPAPIVEEAAEEPPEDPIVVPPSTPEGRKKRRRKAGAGA